MVAKTAINKLKLIPGIANIAADVLNAIVAGLIVFGIGESASIIMERVYKGDVDKNNLDWVNKIVEGAMSDVVQKVTELVSKQQSELNVKGILKALVVEK